MLHIRTWGEHSSIMPQAPARALANQLDAPLVELAGCYHHLPLEAPDALAGHVLAILLR